MLSKISLLGVSVTTSSRQAILSRISRFLSILRPPSSVLRIVTPNPEQIVLAEKNEKFRNILNEADIALPDGAGVVWGINRRRKAENTRLPARQGGQKKSVLRIPGREFMIDLCRLAGEKNKRVLLYGGRGGVAKEALRKLKQVIPNLDGLAIDGAEIEGETIPMAIVEEIVRTIRGRNIHVVFIGLGAPKQEFLMHSLNSKLSSLNSPVVLMVVGGAFDMLAGKIQRAPKLVQQMGFEWLWRFIHEPWRWKRQCVLLTFIRLVLLSKIRDN